jgi:hypothetical protein
MGLMPRRVLEARPLPRIWICPNFAGRKDSNPAEAPKLTRSPEARPLLRASGHAGAFLGLLGIAPTRYLERGQTLLSHTHRAENYNLVAVLGISASIALPQSRLNW